MRLAAAFLLHGQKPNLANEALQPATAQSTAHAIRSLTQGVALRFRNTASVMSLGRDKTSVTAHVRLIHAEHVRIRLAAERCSSDDSYNFAVQPRTASNTRLDHEAVACTSLPEAYHKSHMAP